MYVCFTKWHVRKPGRDSKCWQCLRESKGVTDPFCPLHFLILEIFCGLLLKGQLDCQSPGAAQAGLCSLGVSSASLSLAFFSLLGCLRSKETMLLKVLGELRCARQTHGGRARVTPPGHPGERVGWAALGFQGASVWCRLGTWAMCDSNFIPVTNSGLSFLLPQPWGSIPRARVGT